MRGLRKEVAYEDFKSQYEAGTSCSVCGLIHAIVRRSYSEEELHHALELDDLCCKLFLSRLSAQEYLRRGGITQVYRLDAVLGRSASFGRYETSQTATRDRNKMLAKNLNYLDIILPDRLRELRAERYAMVRAPLRPYLDITKPKAWLSVCESEHRHSTKAHKRRSLAPLIARKRFRLLDVVTGRIEIVQEEVRYVALSYVWGQVMCQYTASPTFADHQRHVDLDACPATVKDAMNVVQSLGVRYMWVDAVCIDQSDAEDKDMNIGAMDAIYSSAYLTIIAADGLDAKQGLRRLHRDDAQAEQMIVVSDSHRSSFGLLPSRPSLDKLLGQSKWNTRAWTFQEHVLSSRCLVFTEDEVFFTCSEEDFREAQHLVRQGIDAHDMATPRKTNNGKKRSTQYAINGSGQFQKKHFGTLVRSYSYRDLTHRGDRLDALSAILEQFRGDDITLEQKTAESGIPLDAMHRGLLWLQDVQTAGVMSRLHTNSRGSRSLPS